MSDKVQAWAWDLSLPPARKIVLLWLAGRATDNGVAFPGEREIRERTGLGERMVRYHLGWLASDRDEHGQPKQPLFIRVERRIATQRNTSNVYILAVPWQQPDAVRRDLEELRHVTKHAMERALVRVGEVHCPQVGAIGCREESSRRNRHRNTPPLPPAGAQQPGLDAEPTRTDASLPPAEASADAAAQLAEAFYRGLGSEVTAVSSTSRRRDLVIAGELVAAGAIPSEAEAYAAETIARNGRIAPVDLRSFERERLGWLALRRGRDRLARGFVDRTGQPPSWQTESPSSMPVSALRPLTGGGAGGMGELASERLAHALHSALAGRSR
jgi:hypothetical protein